MKPLILIAALALCGCQPRTVEVYIVDTYRVESGLIRKKGNWVTVVQYRDGYRTIIPGWLGNKGETIRIESERRK